MASLGGIFGFEGASDKEKTYRNKYDRAVTGAGERTKRSSEGFLNRSEAFDPNEYARQSAMGQFALFMPQLQRQMANLRGQQVGMGRLNTGFATGDMDRLIGAGLSNLNNQLLANAMQAGQMNLQNIGQMGQYASDVGNRYLEAVGGRWATLNKQRQADNASKRGFWGSLIGAIPSAVTAFASLSDERLKEDIEDIDPDDAMDEVRSFRGVSWNWNRFGEAVTGEDRKKKKKGVLAQELEEVRPDLISEDEESGALMVDYGGLTGTIVAAMQNIDRRLNEMEAIHG